MDYKTIEEIGLQQYDPIEMTVRYNAPGYPDKAELRTAMVYFGDLSEPRGYLPARITVFGLRKELEGKREYANPNTFEIESIDSIVRLVFDR